MPRCSLPRCSLHNPIGEEPLRGPTRFWPRRHSHSWTWRDAAFDSRDSFPSSTSRCPRTSRDRQDRWRPFVGDIRCAFAAGTGGNCKQPFLDESGPEKILAYNGGRLFFSYPIPRRSGGNRRRIKAISPNTSKALSRKGVGALLYVL